MRPTTAPEKRVSPGDLQAQRTARLIEIDAEYERIALTQQSLIAERRRLLIDKNIDRLWALTRNTNSSPVPVAECQQVFTALRRGRIAPADSHLPTEIAEWNVALMTAETQLIGLVNRLADYYERRLKR